MRNKQWDCISTLTGLLFVGFIIVTIFSSSWFLENILSFLGIGILAFILYSILKKDKSLTDYPIIKQKLNSVEEKHDNQNKESLLKNKNEIVYELDSSEYESRLLKFSLFLGFQKSNTKNDVVKKLGTPTKDEISKKDDFNSLNYNDILTFNYHKKNKLLLSIDLDCIRNIDKAKAYLNHIGINDMNIDFIGRDKEEILKYFGKPSNEIGSFIFYELENFEVSFFCLHSKQCSIINVSFD